jgi:rubrerythrin
MDIFEFAIEKETFSESFYRQLAAKTENSGLQKIFTMLAGEEAKHRDVITRMRTEIPAEITDTDVLVGAKEIFSKMRNGADKFDFNIEQTEIYKKAQGYEKDSIDFYITKAREVKDDCQKQIFGKLAEEEKKHYAVLENIIEFVSRPEHWLENAEWYHMEEY